MRRRTAVGVVVTCALVTSMAAAVASTAGATSPVVVVPGYFHMNSADLTAALDMGITSCDEPGPPPHGVNSVLVNTSSPAPRGTAFWAEDQWTPGKADGPSRAYASLSDFTTVSLDVLNQNPVDGGNPEGARIYAFAKVGDGTTWSGIADAGQVAPGAGWQTVSGDAGTVFTWLHYPEASLSQQPLSDVPFVGTIAQLEADETGPVEGRVGVAMGCGGGLYGFDAATFGLGDSTEVFDLETTGSTVLEARVNNLVVTAGDTDGVGCDLYDGDDYTWYEEGSVTVQARLPGSHRWRIVGVGRQHVTTGVNGLPAPAGIVVTPQATTIYRCVYDGTFPSVSRPEPILVVDRISAHAHRDTVRRGHDVVVSGHLLPLTPGRRLALFRGRHEIARTRTGPLGHYRFSVPARHLGHLQLLVVSATTRRHVGSVSNPVLVHVVR